MDNTKININGDNKEEIIERIIRFMFAEGYSLEEIEDITEKDLDYIKKIIGL